MISIEFLYPFIVSLHDNQKVQSVNVETGQITHSPINFDKKEVKSFSCLLLTQTHLFIISKEYIGIFSRVSNFAGLFMRYPFQIKSPFRQECCAVIQGNILILGKDLRSYSNNRREYELYIYGDKRHIRRDEYL